MSRFSTTFESIRTRLTQREFGSTFGFSNFRHDFALRGRRKRDAHQIFQPIPAKPAPMKNTNIVSLGVF